MTDPMTPREHDDMRDLLLAGTQRIRPAAGARLLVAAAVAVVVVSGVVGAVATTILTRESPAPVASSPVVVACDAPDPPEAVLPPADVPSPGTTVPLESDPCVTATRDQGVAAWFDETKKTDVGSLRGFQSAGGLQPWTARLDDDRGPCLLLRAAGTDAWTDIACGADGAPARIERLIADGGALRFQIAGDGVVVSYIPWQETQTDPIPPVADGCEPADLPAASLPYAELPAPDAVLTPPPDPCLTAHSLLGSATWLEEHGVDSASVQGFQAVAGIEPWTASLNDGSGSCILLRRDDRNGFADVDCRSDGTAPSVEREVDGAVVRFSNEGGGVEVTVSSR